MSINSQFEMDLLVENIKSILSENWLSYDHEIWWVGAKKHKDWSWDAEYTMEWNDGTGRI